MDPRIHEKPWGNIRVFDRGWGARKREGGLRGKGKVLRGTRSKKNTKLGDTWAKVVRPR